MVPDGPGPTTQPDGPGPTTQPDGPGPTTQPDGSGPTTQPDGPADVDRPAGPATSEDHVGHGAGAPRGVTPDADRGSDGHRHGGALARPHTGGPNVPAPPRRTGVFVDAEELRPHVGGLLRVILGGYEVDAFGNFTFVHDGARIFVTVGATPIGPQIGVFSVTNLDLELTAELAAFLLTRNHTMAFGAFSYDPGNQAVWLRHTLLGSTLDLPELQAAVAAVSATAAAIDDAIQERFGGRTFQQAPDDIQRRMEPPEPETDTSPGVTGYL